MTDSPPDNCARCGDDIRGRESWFRLPAKWRLYLQNERELGPFAMAPVVACCSECRFELDNLKNAQSEVNAYGTETQADEVETELREELDGLDLAAIVDEQVI